jgi:poly-gamma-glutamate capsule biosynthesis protein CapA/YwtB (metallophosphatase superfamily)
MMSDSSAAANKRVISFLGDVYLPEPCAVDMDLPEAYVVNLECSITDEAVGVPGKVHLRAGVNNLRATFGCPPIAVCLANNHTLDYGAEGLKDTMAALEADGILHYGAGTRADNYGNPLFLAVHGHRLALMGYVCPSTHPVSLPGEGAPRVAPLDRERILRDLHKARADGAEIAVVSFHWGVEEVPFPRRQDIRVAREILSGGADLIIGHHAHCIQKIERVAGKFIAYGLGNAIMPAEIAPSKWNRESLVLHFDLDTRSSRFEKTSFDGRTLRSLGEIDPGRLRLNDSVKLYDERIRIVNILRNLRQRWGKFLRKPRIPTPRKIANLVRLFREDPSR